MIKLVTQNDTYTLEYPQEKEGTKTIFTLKKLSTKDMRDIDDATTTITKVEDDNVLKIKSGSIKLLKVEKTLVDWAGVQDNNNQEIKFKKELVLQLPASILEFLVNHIDENNGLVKTTKGDQEEKN